MAQDATILYHAARADAADLIRARGLGRVDVTASRDIAVGFAAAIAENRGEPHAFVVSITPLPDELDVLSRACAECGGHCPVIGPVPADRVALETVDLGAGCLGSPRSVLGPIPRRSLAANDRAGLRRRMGADGRNGFVLPNAAVKAGGGEVTAV
jgi:hypothetical protein